MRCQKKIAFPSGQLAEFFLMRGLSKNEPFCDGSHKTTHDEEEGRTYDYDPEGHRHEI
ncbi:MAG: iron-binding protein [Verrucomicrobia bacterium]|nr:MAG: iron-binding protein [Verrucomicrobiota bacterium]